MNKETIHNFFTRDDLDVVREALINALQETLRSLTGYHPDKAYEALLNDKRRALCKMVRLIETPISLEDIQDLRGALHCQTGRIYEILKLGKYPTGTPLTTDRRKQLKVKISRLNKLREKL